jgi:uncharacterized SAM-binding protein YcdF (DUF218 family)
MTDFLMAQSNILSMLVWLAVAAFVFYRFKKKKTAVFFIVLTVVVFYLFSTAWLPRYLVKQLELKYEPLNPALLKNNTGKIYIHLLGSGYQVDKRLPATAELGIVSQARIVEAMRLYNAIDNSVLVCSAGGPPGEETQASVAKKAAILLGADSNRVITLDTPTTTIEEAESLAKAIGTKQTVIVVTDALHIPRAMKVFKRQGFDPIAAPTNFRAINGSEGVSIKWWPRVENLEVTDRLLHEYFASIKAGL